MKKVILFYLIFCILGTVGFSENMRILVTTFVNNSSEEYGWLGFGIEASLIADIVCIRDIEVISTQDRKKAIDELAYQLSGLVDSEKVLRVGKMLGANVILSGEYTMIGQEIRLTARLSLVEKGVVISSIKLDGNIHSIFEMQDEIVIKLLSGIKKNEAKGLKAVKFTNKEIQAIKKRNSNLNTFEYMAKGLELTATVPQEFLDIEQLIFKYINKERAKAGLSPYLYNHKLAALGRYHSMNMQVYNFFDLTDQNGMNPRGRKLMLAPELFGTVGQVIAWTYGGNADEVAKKFVSEWIKSDLKGELLSKVYNYVGVGIFRGDSDRYRYYCTVVPADLMVELVSSIPKTINYGADLELTFKFIGTFKKDQVGIVVRFPDRGARFYQSDGSYFEGYGVYSPEKWNGEFFTIKIKCENGRGAYVIQPARGDQFYTFGVTFIAQ